jgi:hypothetical protein
MRRRNSRSDDDDDDDDVDPEGPDARDLPDDDPDATDTVDCPHCGAEVYVGSERCPACGEYVTDAAMARRSIPLWVTLTVIFCIALVVLTMVL